MKLLWLLLMTQAVSLTSAQYHEISVQKILAPKEALELRNDSLFGFSVTYEADIRSLIISAPTADDIGKIYSCDIDLKTNCTRVKANIIRESEDYPHDYWLGATVKASSDFFITCAPRFVKIGLYGEYGEYARCYKSTNGKDLQPMTMPNLKPMTTYQEGWVSYGWSLDIGADNTAVIGGPAMFTGNVMRIKETSLKSIDGRRVNIKFNLGYGVAIGDYFKRNKPSYAVGSPYGEDGRGKVLFFDQNWSRQSVTLTVKKIGTMFGAVLASAHISNTNTADLLVGAPTNFIKEDYEFNVGAVYYYQPQKTNNYKKVIIGKKVGSFFGSAIISVGDLNADKRDEIAVAAPYEDDGRGAVYLYCGSKILDNKNTDVPWLQRIQPETYRSFGLSLSALKDYDSNGCNELAIGAPDDNAILLYRCMASVSVNVFAKFPNLQDRRNKTYTDRNETYFIFQSCLDVKYPNKLKEIIANIQVKVEIVHTHATLAMPHEDGKYNVSLHERKPQYCENIGVNMPENGNYGIKILYKIEASLLESPINRTDFDSRRVILSSLSELTHSDHIWAAECKDKNACMPKLKLNMRLSTGESIIISNNMPISVSLDITNDGEMAYDPCLRLKVDGAPFQKFPTTSCKFKGAEQDELECSPTFVLKTNASWVIDNTVLETKQMTNKDTHINITARVYDHCSDTNAIPKLYTKVIRLMPTFSGIGISGSTNIGNVVTVTSVEDKTTGKQFQQAYTVTNNGPHIWKNVACKILLPRVILPYISLKNDSVAVAAVDSPPEFCEIDTTGHTDYVTASCMLPTISSTVSPTIYVDIHLKPNTIDDIVTKYNATITTILNLYFSDTKIKQHSVKTIVMLKHIEVPWWIILIATIIAIFILIIVILILRQFGFLKRKQKKKLKDLRKSVRRQTVRRSAMHQQSEDRRRLTGVPVEVEEAGPDCVLGVDNKSVTIQEAH